MTMTLDGTLGITATGSLTGLTTAITVAQGGTGVTTSTGTGNTVLSAAPTFTGQATIPTINLTGGQIVFPATQSASVDGNTLDDYEDGTWSPTIDSSVAGTGRATTITNATYTKIGNCVIATCYLALPTLGTGGSGNLAVKGLPYACAGYQPVLCGYVSGLNATLYTVSGYTSQGSTQIILTGSTSLSVSPLAELAFTTYAKAAMQIMVSVTYQV